MKSILQTPEWAKFKSLTSGWSNFFISDFQVLVRKLPLNKYFFYIPEPSSKDWKNDLTKILKESEPEIKKYHPIFIRIEPLEKNTEEINKILKKSGFKPAFEEVQPRHRQWVDITTTIEEILKQMKPKGRYNIKVAEKHNIKITPSTPNTIEKDLAKFYSLYQETASRDNFTTRPKSYFKTLLENLYQNNLGQLYVATYNNQPVAGAIITFYKDYALYIYGASSSSHRNTMAPYLIHWQAIKDAKEKGCKIYDLLAIAPENITTHKHVGLNQFKKQFGGESIELTGGWDYILSPVWYFLFKTIQKIRRR